MTYITPTSTTAPVSPAEAQATALPTETPRRHDEVAERRGSAPMVLRPVSHAE